MMESAVTELTAVVGTSGACAAVGRSRATHYRRLNPPAPAPKREPTPQPRALSVIERTRVLEVLHSGRFVDMAPPSVYATLLDEGTYLASVPTMYRILRSVDEVRERRRVAIHPAHVKPELAAWRPNTIWSSDITKLLGPFKWTYYYLYVILDIFSRYVAGWMVASCERAALAERLLADSIRKHGVDRDQLTPGRMPTMVATAEWMTRSTSVRPLSLVTRRRPSIPPPTTMTSPVPDRPP